jgi:hypothetical protein
MTYRVIVFRNAEHDLREAYRYFGIIRPQRRAVGSKALAEALRPWPTTLNAVVWRTPLKGAWMSGSIPRKAVLRSIPHP